MYQVVYSVLWSLNKIILSVTFALISWIFELFNKIGLDNKIIEVLFPFTEKISDSFVLIGSILTLLLFLMSIFLMIFPFSDIEPPAENAYQLVFRFALALLFVNFFRDFFEVYIFGSVKYTRNVSNGVSKNVTGFVNIIFDYYNSTYPNIGTSLKNYFQSIIKEYLNEFSNYNSADFLSKMCNVSIIILAACLFLFNLIKFLIFHFEKLLFTKVLLYLFPIPCCTLVTKKTSTVFMNYLKLIIINSCSLIFNLFMMYTIAAGLINLSKLQTDNSYSDEWQSLGNGLINNSFFSSTGFDRTVYLLLAMLIFTGAIKVAKKGSQYISQLFQTNGMVDTIRDGLGAVGAVVGTSMLALRTVNRGGGKSAMSGKMGTGDTDGMKAKADLQKQYNDSLADKSYMNGMTDAQKTHYMNYRKGSNGFDGISPKEAFALVNNDSKNLDRQINQAANENGLTKQENEDLKEMIGKNSEAFDNPNKAIDTGLDNIMMNRIANSGFSENEQALARQYYGNNKGKGYSPQEAYQFGSAKAINEIKNAMSNGATEESISKVTQSFQNNQITGSQFSSAVEKCANEQITGSQFNHISNTLGNGNYDIDASLKSIQRHNGTQSNMVDSTKTEPSPKPGSASNYNNPNSK